MISERTNKALKELGLTGYEIKAYISLLEFGTMTAAETSRRSGVPYSKIHEVLAGLEGKGWVESEHSRPSRFYPKSPSTALETIKMKLETERRRNEEHVMSELIPLYAQKGVREKPEIWIVRGEFNIMTKVKETIQSCEKELMIAVPSILGNAPQYLRPMLINLKEKGISVKMLASGLTDEEALTMEQWAEVRLREQMFGGGVIGDAMQVVLLLGGGDEGSSYLAIWAEHSGLAKFAKDYFEYLWNDSKPIHRVRA